MSAYSDGLQLPDFEQSQTRTEKSKRMQEYIHKAIKHKKDGTNHSVVLSISSSRAGNRTRI